MNYKFSQLPQTTGRTRRQFLTATLLFASAFGAVTHASAQAFASPSTPRDITPPEGNTAFLVGHALGSQGYTCLPTNIGGTAWNPTARPEATLFTSFFGESVQIITHFTSINANPKDVVSKPVPLSGNATWQSSFDTSKVWAAAVGHIDAGSDQSCPNAGAIQCLLLQSIGNQEGPTGGKLLVKTTYVQRLNTKGGSAPTTACLAGQTQLVPYTADYYFFRPTE
jgi:Protein of unknown function (DUF3455)